MASELARKGTSGRGAATRSPSARRPRATPDCEKELREQLEREKAAALTRDRERPAGEAGGRSQKTSDEEKQAAVKLLADKQVRAIERQDKREQQAQKLKAEIERLQAEAKKASEEAAAARTKAQAGAVTQVGERGDKRPSLLSGSDRPGEADPGRTQTRWLLRRGDSDWTSAAMQRSIKSMARYAKPSLRTPDMPSKAKLLDDLKSPGAPLSARLLATSGRKQRTLCGEDLRQGRISDLDGDCVAKPVAKAKPKPEPKPKTEARRPVERAERPVAADPA